MSEELDVLLEQARKLSWRTSGKRIRFYAPSFIHYQTSNFRSSPTIFPSISITGNACALQCKHCGGRVLSTMIPATNPATLFEVCQRVKEQGGTGCLISGGCLPDGTVPFQGFVDAIRQIKRELHLTIVVHSGIIRHDMATQLKDVGVDAVLIDIIGSEATVQDIYNLAVHVEDYEASLQALHDSGIAFVPHVIVGLHYGRLKGEFNALHMISRYKPNALVIIALIPLKGTLLEGCPPPKPEEIARVLAMAKVMLPDTPLALGCMRPIGDHRIRTDMLAVKAGVNAIAYPEDQAIALAESMGLEVSFSSICCSQIYEELGVP